MENNLELLLENEHPDPHSFLGLHKNTIRIFRPNYNEVCLQLNNKRIKARKIDPRGLFEYKTDSPIKNIYYKIYFTNKTLQYDPYSFETTLCDTDIEKFLRKDHFYAYKILGAHRVTIQGVKGMQFSLWAPKAKGVALVGNFNDWNDKTHLLRNVKNSGIWQIFIPSLGYNEHYKYHITTQFSEPLVKTDPFAYYTELRPHNNAITFDLGHYEWTDNEWINKRKSRDLSRPINIYEVHFQSWMKGDDYFLNYRDLAHRLAPYLNEMGFNYAEILPILEHPLDDSWGYQISGYFAITSRYGSPLDFQYFVDYMNKHNIGVILDWVPSHFPVDNFALAHFDGSELFEKKIKNAS